MNPTTAPFSAYIAAARLDLDRARELSRLLAFLDVQTTSTWHMDTSINMDDAPLPQVAAQSIAAACVVQLHQADVVIVVRPEVGGTGVWVEFGLAVGLGKPVLLIDGARLIAGEARVVARRTAFEELDQVTLVLDDRHLTQLLAARRSL